MSRPSEDARFIEALVFAADAPLSVAEIANRLPAGTDAAALLAGLAAEYEGRGIALVCLGGRWSFRTAADLGARLVHERVETRRLSRAAMETLAIIAYHQPVTRADIESVRGVSVAKGTLDVLLEAGWVRPGRRRDTPGRPVTWVTTPAFMDHFGLERMTDLPGMRELKDAGLLDTRPAANIYGEYGERADSSAGASPEAADDGHEPPP